MERLRSPYLVLAPFAVTWLVAAASPSAGQSQSPSGAVEATEQSQPAPPIVLEPIKSGFIVAPDFRVTEVDDFAGTLVGGYGGWLQAEALFVGAGAYWLTNASSEFDMYYGGVVVGWQLPVGKMVKFGARGLFGGGEARLVSSHAVNAPGCCGRSGHPGFGRGADDRDWTTIGRRVRYDQGFLLAEPQADAAFRFGDWMRLSLGVGYRFVGAADGAEDRIRGVSGSISLQFGNGF